MTIIGVYEDVLCFLARAYGLEWTEELCADSEDSLLTDVAKVFDKLFGAEVMIDKEHSQVSFSYEGVSFVIRPELGEALQLVVTIPKAKNDRGSTDSAGVLKIVFNGRIKAVDCDFHDLEKSVDSTKLIYVQLRRQKAVGDSHPFIQYNKVRMQGLGRRRAIGRDEVDDPGVRIALAGIALD